MKIWRHVIINTRCSWLHGDKRGFRSREHRIHSSGDYLSPPSADEHKGLRAYHEQRSGKPVRFPKELRGPVIREFVLKMQSLDHSIVVCSCGNEHLHALVALPPDDAGVKREMGKCKQKVSHALRDALPGSIWSAGGDYRRLWDQAHYDNVYDYIRNKQEPGTVVWTDGEGEDWIVDRSVGCLVVSDDHSLTRISCADEESEESKESGSSGVPSDAGV